MLDRLNYRFDAAAFAEYTAPRMQQPHFANARSIRNAIDRARLRHANRLFGSRGSAVTQRDLVTLAAADIRASRVFTGSTNASVPA
jgi:hypothetical protein